jgi:hypothetical protein
VLIHNLLTAQTIEEDLLRISETKGALLEIFTSLEDSDDADDSSIPFTPEPSIPVSPSKKGNTDFGVENVSDVDLERRKNELLELVARFTNEGDASVAVKSVDTQITREDDDVSRPPGNHSDISVMDGIIVGPKTAQNIGCATTLDSRRTLWASVSNTKGTPSGPPFPLKKGYGPRSDTQYATDKLGIEDNILSSHDFNQDNGLDHLEETMQLVEAVSSAPFRINNRTPEGSVAPQGRSPLELKDNLSMTPPSSSMMTRDQEEYPQHVLQNDVFSLDPQCDPRNEVPFPRSSMECEVDDPSSHNSNHANGLDHSKATMQLGEAISQAPSLINNRALEGSVAPRGRSPLELKDNLSITPPPSSLMTLNQEEYPRHVHENDVFSLDPQYDLKNDVPFPRSSMEYEDDDPSSHNPNHENGLDHLGMTMQPGDVVTSESFPIKNGTPDGSVRQHMRFTADQKGKWRAVVSPSPSPTTLNQGEYPPQDLEQVEENQQQAEDFPASLVHIGATMMALLRHRDFVLATELQMEEDRQLAMSLAEGNLRTAKLLPPIPGPSKTNNSLGEVHSESLSPSPSSDAVKWSDSVSQDATSMGAVLARSVSELSSTVRIFINIQ